VTGTKDGLVGIMTEELGSEITIVTI